MNTMIFADPGTVPDWLEHTQSIGGAVWIKGAGTLPCETMFIGEHPGKEEMQSGAIFTGPAGVLMRSKADAVGFSMANTYLTNVVKYFPRGKSPSAEDIKVCAPLLQEEIKRAQPKLIVCLGAKALIAVMGRGHKLASYRGTVLMHPTLSDVKVFPMYSPSYILRDPDAEREYDADWRMLAKVQRGESTQGAAPNFTIVHTAEEVRNFKDWFLANSADFTLGLDCEWDGENYMSPTAYIRTVQLGFKLGEALIIELFDENMQVIGEYKAIFEGPLKELLEDSRVKLFGHHLRADGLWLLAHGIDIRTTSWYDTMVAEHTINSVGPFGLEAATTKYTGMGRYDMAVMDWVNKHKGDTENGYGKVPSAILMPYGACDVEAPRQIIPAQAEALKPFTQPRPPYPSVWDIDMFTSAEPLYELELTGLLVDKERLAKMTTMYQTKRDELESKIVIMAATLGMPDFNVRSNPQKQKLLFGMLKLLPVESTEGKPWDWVLTLPRERQERMSPATSKETMSILADQPGAHPIVALVRDYTKVDYVCRQWLTDPTDTEGFNTQTKGGGLLSKIWPDGRLHARFSQLKETARFSSSKPNVQNWLKKAEGELKRIIGIAGVEAVFGAGFAFPSLRSILVPSPGYVYMEGDWKQAELFVLAALSGDKTMWDALNTPGKDLHDLTAITAFGLQVLGPDDKPVPETVLLNLALRDPKAFKELQSQLIYVDQRGRRLTRKAFKDGIRVSAKNLGK